MINAKTELDENIRGRREETVGHVEFEHVGFSYNGKRVLQDISYTAKPGETIAIVGQTGAGKTSLARLIVRFFEFQGGELLLDGRDIRRLSLARYRRHIGIVPQEPFLFSGTVKDNIRYGLSGKTEPEVVEAARQVAGGTGSATSLKAWTR